MKDAWEWLAVGLQMACRWLVSGLGWLGPALFREGERPSEPKHFRETLENRARADAPPLERPPEQHKHLEWQKQRPGPVFPWHFTGGTLVPLWYHPGTIDIWLHCLNTGHQSWRPPYFQSISINISNPTARKPEGQYPKAR